MCLGNNTCANNRTGVACGSCPDGYIGTAQACIQCPIVSPEVLLFEKTSIFVGGAIFLSIMWFLLSCAPLTGKTADELVMLWFAKPIQIFKKLQAVSKKAGKQGAAIATDPKKMKLLQQYSKVLIGYLQVIGSMAGLKVSWPESLSSGIGGVSTVGNLFNFDLMTLLACAFIEVPYHDKFHVTMTVPIVVCISLVIPVGISWWFLRESNAKKAQNALIMRGQIKADVEMGGSSLCVPRSRTRYIETQIPGLIRFYACDEGDGSVVMDVCGSGQDAVFAQAEKTSENLDRNPTWQMQYLCGKERPVLAFAPNCYAFASGLGLPEGNSKRTLVGWFKMNAGINNNDQSSSPVLRCGPFGWGLNVIGESAESTSAFDADKSRLSSKKVNSSDHYHWLEENYQVHEFREKWLHVAIVWDGAQTIVYKNGIPSVDDPTPWPPTPPSSSKNDFVEFILGGNVGMHQEEVSGMELNYGNIANVGVFDRALSEEEILMIAQGINWKDRHEKTVDTMWVRAFLDVTSVAL